MNGPLFKTVVFDLDGTVADTAPDLAEALNAALDFLGRPAQSLQTVRTMIGHGTRALLAKGLAVTGGSRQDLVEIGHPVLLRHYERHICDLTRPYDGIEAAMDRLADQGVSLAICTNKPQALTSRLIEALGWHGRFVAVVGGDTWMASKPDPAPLHQAIRLAGGVPAVFVGDSIIDVQTALAARVPCIAVSFGYADRPASALGADRVIHHFDDLWSALSEVSVKPGSGHRRL